MSKLKKIRVAVGMIIFVPMLMLFLLPTSLAIAKPLSFCANASCAKQKAILRQLERTRPSKKVTKKQIFNRIKAACDKMRSLDCPDIRNYKPSICFTDF
jgi:hypothetical protein